MSHTSDRASTRPEARTVEIPRTTELNQPFIRVRLAMNLISDGPEFHNALTDPSSKDQPRDSPAQPAVEQSEGNASIDRTTPLHIQFKRRFDKKTDYAVEVARRLILYPMAWANRRLRTNVTVVGITGSAGKTTTKDLCSAILSEFGPCESTFRSENGRFQVAQTIFGLRKQHRYGVVELSAGRPGYLDFSLQLVKPNIGVLTVIARDHYSAFKSIEAIAAEKGKIVSALPENGVAVLNIDDPMVRAIGERSARRIIWVGKSPEATLRLLEARSFWPEPLTLRIQYQGRSYEVQTRLHGTHLALSVIAALGVAIGANLPLENAIEALKKVESPEGRMQIVQSDDGVIFVRDDWKAPLWSLIAPLDFMKQATAKRKVLIIGTLSDYSASATKVYPKTAKQALDIGNLVVFVGPHAHRALKANVDQPDRVLRAFSTIGEAAAFLREGLHPGDLVLLKGSHKADHLVRLLIDRTGSVHCWKDKCDRSIFCGGCPDLSKPSGSPLTASQVPDMEAQGDQQSRALRHANGASVLVGLGNPGERHHNTPHNIGYRTLDYLCEAAGGAWTEEPEGLVSQVTLDGVPVALLKPATYMNRSGDPVLRFLNRIESPLSRCIIIHDDLDLSFGDVRLKMSGGDAGHKGVRSVVSALGSGEFRRVRVGMRRSDDRRRALELVLADYSPSEESMVRLALEKAASIARKEATKSSA